MNKIFKLYGCAWLALVATTIVTIAVMIMRTSHHDLAADPNNIEKIVKIDLPDLTFVESENNLKRGTSRWDMYIHRGQFAYSLTVESVQLIDQMCVTNRSNWYKNEDEGYYIYTDAGGIDELYFITCFLYDDHFHLTYEVDESEGIFVLFPLIVAYMILLVWGLLLLIINNLRKNNKQS